MSINFMSYAFVINQNDNFYFIFQSTYSNSHIEIEWKKENELNFNKNLSQVKIQSYKQFFDSRFDN